MKTLIKKTLILLVPFLLYFTVPFLVLFATNELNYNLNKAIKGMISGKKYLVGFAFDETTYNNFKYSMLYNLPRQDVVVIGSSRVLQFRANMFSNSKFYNAGFTISSIKDYETFISLIPDDKIPKILIVGLDQWFFNKNYSKLIKKTSKNVYLQYTPPSAPSVIKNRRKIYKKLFDGTLKKYLYDQYHDNNLINLHSNNQLHKIGFNAYINKTGFRNDGSMFYGNWIEGLLTDNATLIDDKFSETFKHIDIGTKRFQYANNVDRDALNDLQKFLNFCKAKDIYVIALLPPFSDSVYKKMVSTGKYNYLSELSSYLPVLLSKYNYEFYDFSRISSTGSNDEELLDGIHGSESVCLNMLIKMLSAGSKLSQQTDINLLINASKNKKNRYSVFDY